MRSVPPISPAAGRQKRKSCPTRRSSKPSLTSCAPNSPTRSVAANSSAPANWPTAGFRNWRKNSSAIEDGRSQRRDGRGDGYRRSRCPGRLALDRRAGRPDARRREGKAAAHGRRACQARHRPAGSRACGFDRGAARTRRIAGSAPPDRLVHVSRAHRRRQDRADQSTRRISCSTTKMR